MAAEPLAFVRVGVALAEFVAYAAGQDRAASGVASTWKAVESVLGLKSSPRGREQKAVAEALAATIGQAVRVERTDGNQDAIERVNEAVAARIKTAGRDDGALLAAHDGHQHFIQYLMAHGAAREQNDQDSDWERDLYGHLLSAAAIEFAHLVRQVPRLLEALNIDTNQRVRVLESVMGGVAETVRQLAPARPGGWALAAGRCQSAPNRGARRYEPRRRPR